MSYWYKTLSEHCILSTQKLAQFSETGLGFFFPLISLGGSAGPYLILLSFDVISFLGSTGHFHLICCSFPSWDTGEFYSLLLSSPDTLLTQESKNCQSQKLLHLLRGFRKSLLACGVVTVCILWHPHQIWNGQPIEWKEILEVIWVLLLLSSKEQGIR